MAINSFGVKYILEIQNKEESEGMLAAERIIVRVHDDGAGAFLSLECENLEPDDEYNQNMVTMGQNEISQLADVLTWILSEHDITGGTE